MPPRPEQIQAAMPAVREWVEAEVYRLFQTDDPDGAATRRRAEPPADNHVRYYVDLNYPGGVDQFIADQEER